MSNIKKIASKGVSDLEVLRGIATNDSGMITHLYRVHFPHVERLIINNNGTKDQAKDIFQETVLVLYDKVTQQGLSLECKLKTFIYAVSRNLWLKQLSKKGERHYSLEDEQIEQLESVDGDMQAHQEQERKFEKMEDALQMLGEPCQSIIKEFYIQNKSMQDICDKFGYTNTDNAKTQKYKCLQRLKKLFFGKID